MGSDLDKKEMGGEGRGASDRNMSNASCSSTEWKWKLLRMSPNTATNTNSTNQVEIIADKGVGNVKKTRQGGEGRSANDSNTVNVTGPTMTLGDILGRGTNIAPDTNHTNQAAVNVETRSDKGVGNVKNISGAPPLSSCSSSLTTRNGILCCVGFASVGLVSWLLSRLISRRRRSPSPSKDSSPGCMSVINIPERGSVSENCPICRETFEKGEEAFRLNCGHIYHDGCLIPWLNIRNICPVCRSDLPPLSHFLTPKS